MCGRAYETYTDKELNARYIRGVPTADDIQQLLLVPEPVYNLCPTMKLTGTSRRRRQPTIGLDALAAYSAIRIAFQDEADYDQRQKRDRVHKFGVRRTRRAPAMHRSDKRILRMEARRKDQKALQD